MKILIISPNLPYPLDSGGNQAQFHLTKHLQNKIEITYLVTTTESDINNLDALKKEWNKVNIITYKKPSSLKFKLNRLLLTLREKIIYNRQNDITTLSPATFYTEDFLNFLNNIIKTNKFDFIQTEFYNYLPLIHALPTTCKRIFIQHEIHYIITKIKKAQSKKQNLLKNFHWEKLYTDEIAALNKYDAIVTLTEVDKIKLQKENITTPIFESPALIDSSNKRNKCNYKNKLIFIGGSNHTPNIESLNWFISNIWSTILLKHPETKLNIIGKWDKKLIKKFTKSSTNINFLGFVEDLQKEIDGAISIIPILIGSGMRMKIIDAANYGSPFVTTSIGVEGLNFINNEDCYIADTSESFTQKTISLIESNQTQKQFYNNSYIKIQKSYSKEILVSKRLDIYKTLLNS